MGQTLKRENISISIGEYQKDGQTKQKWRTIGELVTYQNDDGSIKQFGEMWGAGGCTSFNIYEQRDRQQQGQPQQQYQQQPPQQMAPPPQQAYNAPPQGQPMGAHQAQGYNP